MIEQFDIFDITCEFVKTQKDTEKAEQTFQVKVWDFDILRLNEKEHCNEQN